MSSEYDPLFSSRSSSGGEDEDLEAVRERFQAAGTPYLASPWTWCAWALLLPAAALATPLALAAAGFAGTLFLWSAAILVGGGIEATAMRRAGAGGSALASWAMRVQGNLSLVALVLSVLLLWRGEAWALPGLWLLLLGHSFFQLGGLSFPALKRYGLTYQLGGLVALVAASHALTAFAVTTALANGGLALAAWRRRREARGDVTPARSARRSGDR